MTNIMPVQSSSESISQSDRRGQMAQLVCPNCSKVVESATASPWQCPSCGHTFPVADDSTHSQFRAAPTVVAPTEELPGQIGRYLVERILGKGGFGIVYKAWDPELERWVAIKIPRADTGRHPSALARFEREGRSAAQLRHPGIASVYTVEHEGGIPFIVSEYVDGVTLTDRLRTGPPYTFRQSAELLKALASAVQYAHSRGVVHRDIKPSNILIATDGTPRLLDFGLAIRESIDESIAMPFHVIGTPGYMSPEQASGKDKVDRRCDIYSLGVVLYQLITGEVPFRGEPRMILRQVIDEDPRNPRSLNADIPPDLDTICETAMMKEVGKRYQTAAKLADELQRYLDGVPIEARRITRLDRTWRWCRRNPLTSTLVASIAFLLTASALGATVMYASEHRARTQVEELLEEKSELLSKSYVEKANRFLGPPTEADEFTPIKALPWLYAAFENDQHNPKRWEASRIRLGAALRHTPRVEKIWSHRGGITVAALSPSGDRFVTGGEDGKVFVWNVAKDEPEIPAMVHPGRVTGATFTSDGKSIATGCTDGSIRVWAVATGKLVVGPIWDTEFTKSKSAPEVGHFVSVSVVGQSLLSVCDNKSAQVWDIATGRPVGNVIVLSTGSRSAQFADSGKLAIAAHANGAIMVWETQTGKEQGRLQEKGKGPTLAQVGRDGITVAATEAAESVRLWNCRSGQKLGEPLVHSNPVTALQFSYDNRLLATATEDGTCYLWKVGDGSLLWKRRLSSARVSNLDFATDGRRLAVVNGLHGMISIVDVERGEPASEPIHIPNVVYLARWLPEKDVLLTAGYDGAIRLWRTKPQEPTFLLPSGLLASAAVSGDHQTLATMDDGGTCCISKLDPDGSQGGADTASNQTGINRAAVVAISVDGAKVAFADSRSAVSLWDARAAKKIHDLDPGGRIPRPVPLSDIRLAFSTDGRLLINLTARRGERSCRINVWDALSGARLQSERFDMDGDFGDFDLQSQGSLCAVAGGKQVIIWDATTGRRVDPILSHESRVMSCRLSDDGGRVLTGCSDGVARVWSLPMGKVVAASQNQSDAILSVAFSVDCARFATGCADGTARIWSTANAGALTAPLPQGAPATGCSFSPNSRWLLTTTGDARSPLRSPLIVRAWDASTGEPLFGLPLSLLQASQPGISRPNPLEPVRLQCSFFSADSRRLHLVLGDGLVATLSLEPDARTPSELLREVMLRSGTELDRAGGASTLESDRLVRIYRDRH
jgi:eukaryotic-like serine/threonine-protein kinase